MTCALKRISAFSLGVALLSSALCYAAAQSPPQTQPAKRSIQAIMQDLQSANAELSQMNPSELLDEAKRKEVAVKAVPAMKKMVALAEEMSLQDQPQAAQQGRTMRGQLMSFLVVMGDKEATTRLETQAKSKDVGEATSAKSNLLFAHWMMAHNDAAAQEKLAAEAANLARDNPKDDQLTQSLFAMSRMGAASPELSVKIEDVVMGMKSDSAQQMAEMLQSSRKLRALESKPLVIAGAKNGGGQFSTADWKGKVILVDFWATWCGPCREELPRVKKAYADWHGKGLEVLGVSCDQNGDELNQFLKANPDMPWPQLFDPKTPGWHPLATGYGITGIPTMFLIDKKGVVRSVSARENFEEMIPKLLEEKESG